MHHLDSGCGWNILGKESHALEYSLEHVQVLAEVTLHPPNNEQSLPHLDTRSAIKTSKVSGDGPLALKDAGNGHFKAGRFEAALEVYAFALQACMNETVPETDGGRAKQTNLPVSANPSDWSVMRI